MVKNTRVLIVKIVQVLLVYRAKVKPLKVVPNDFNQKVLIKALTLANIKVLKKLVSETVEQAHPGDLDAVNSGPI